MSGFNKPITDLLNKSDKQDSIQIGLTFSSKEDNADMKLDFFESEISHLTEDKSSKNLGLNKYYYYYQYIFHFLCFYICSRSIKLQDSICKESVGDIHAYCYRTQCWSGR